MTYHKDPKKAASVVHQVFCPASGRVDPVQIFRFMKISLPDGSREDQLAEVGRRILADPADIPEFIRELEQLDGVREPMADT